MKRPYFPGSARWCVALILTSLIIQSCYQYRVLVPTDRSRVDLNKKYEGKTKPHKRNGEVNSTVIYNWLWGAIQKEGYYVQATECINPESPSQKLGMSTVTMKKSFGQSMATFFTLGFYSPATIEWTCQPPAGRTGDLH